MAWSKVIWKNYKLYSAFMFWFQKYNGYYTNVRTNLDDLCFDIANCFSALKAFIFKTHLWKILNCKVMIYSLHYKSNKCLFYPDWTCFWMMEYFPSRTYFLNKTISKLLQIAIRWTKVGILKKLVLPPARAYSTHKSYQLKIKFPLLPLKKR